ncbi:MAG: hypothetical protein AAGF28_00825 [Pseudomonadota bacterium]
MIEKADLQSGSAFFPLSPQRERSGKSFRPLFKHAPAARQWHPLRKEEMEQEAEKPAANTPAEMIIEPALPEPDVSVAPAGSAEPEEQPPRQNDHHVAIDENVLALLSKQIEDTLQTAVKEAVAHFELDLVDALMPLVDADVTRRCVQAATKELDNILQEDTTQRLTLRGPKDIINTLRDQPLPNGIVFESNDSPDGELVATLGDRVMSTRYNAITAQLRELLTP